MNSVRRILAVFMLIIIALSLSACGKTVEGAWKLTGGNAISAIYSLSGASLESAGAEVIFRFGPEGALTLEMTRDSITDTATGTWSEDGDALTLNIGSQPLNCTCSVDENTLTIFFRYQDQNADFVFSKI